MGSDGGALPAANTAGMPHLSQHLSGQSAAQQSHAGQQCMPFMRISGARQIPCGCTIGCLPDCIVSFFSWKLRGVHGMLQAKSEAFLAGNFGALKHHVALNDLGKDTWMRLMYAANYTGSSCMETLLRLWITQGFFPYPTKA